MPPGWITTDPRYVASIGALHRATCALERDDFKPFVARVHYLWSRLVLGRFVDPESGAFGAPGPTSAAEFSAELDVLHIALRDRAAEVEESAEGAALKSRLAAAAEWLRQAGAVFPQGSAH